jgi:LuxR family maltose regulon positive regulatory protein
LPVAGFPAIRLGDVQREWNQLDRAEVTLQQALDLCLRLNHLDILADAHVALARLRLARGEWESAAEHIAAAEQLVAQTNVDGFVESWLQGIRLRLWLATDQLAAAVQWAEQHDLRPDGELSYYFDLHHIHLARLLLAQAEAENDDSCLQAAQSLLTRLVQAADRAGWIHDLIQVRLLQARAYAMGSEKASARQALTAAVRLAEPGRYLRSFVDEGPVVAALLRQVDESSSYASMLLAAVSDGRPQPYRHLPDPLSERELEVLRFLPTHLTSTEIAEALTLSVNTVRTHIKNVYGKLGVHSRGEAVARAKALEIL